MFTHIEETSNKLRGLKKTNDKFNQLTKLFGLTTKFSE